MAISQQRDHWPTGEWRTSTPEQQKMDSTILSGLDTYLQDIQK